MKIIKVNCFDELNEKINCIDTLIKNLKQKKWIKNVTNLDRFKYNIFLQKYRNNINVDSQCKKG